MGTSELLFRITLRVRFTVSSFSFSSLYALCFSPFLLQPRKGSGISLHTISSSLGGTYSVAIDGTPPQSLSSYDTTVEPNQPVCSTPYSNQALDPNVQHTIVVSALGSGQVDFDSFMYVLSSLLGLVQRYAEDADWND